MLVCLCVVHCVMLSSVCLCLCCDCVWCAERVNVFVCGSLCDGAWCVFCCDYVCLCVVLRMRSCVLCCILLCDDVW